eukprot:4297800-Prymnesium_polylepis.1
MVARPGRDSSANDRTADTVVANRDLTKGVRALGQALGRDCAKGLQTLLPVCEQAAILLCMTMTNRDSAPPRPALS